MTDAVDQVKYYSLTAVTDATCQVECVFLSCCKEVCSPLNLLGYLSSRVSLINTGAVSDAIPFSKQELDKPEIL